MQTVLGIHRVDYMMNYREGVSSEGVSSESSLLTVKQTEVNTTAASVAMMTLGRMQDYHQ
jgi:hypothetical protein